MTVPDAAAWIGVPYPTPMSMPSCIRPQRIPNGLTTGPLTGQIRPCEEGVESLDPEEEDDDDETDDRCAAWICAASCELDCWRPSTSCRYACLVSCTDASCARSAARAPESLWLDASSAFRTARTCSVRTAITRGLDAETAFTFFVFARAPRTSSRAAPTSVAIFESERTTSRA